jgi:flagellar hook-associated protein 1 FlgK
MGVNVDDISRLRDQFLETRGATEHGTQGRLGAVEGTMGAIEQAFGEPGENGLQAQMSEFWNNWDKLASGNESAQNLVIEQAKTLVAVFHQADSDLKQLAETSTEKVANNVTALNAMARNVADLNGAIRDATNAGASPNELKDQRDLLISKMSQIADISIKPGESGSVSVYVGGTAMVREDRVTSLQMDTTAAGAIELRWDVDGDVNTTADGFAANVTGGEIGGLVESVNSIIPRYSAMINNVATSLITTVNTQHRAGQDSAGNAGGDFFSGTNAADIDIDAALAADPTKIAGAAVGGGPTDKNNALAMADLGTSPTGPDAEYRKLINILGVESQRSTRQLNIQNDIVNSVDTQRLATSGVNLDEEMTNLIRYQKAYNASAKYLTIMDDALGTLIGMIR